MAKPVNKLYVGVSGIAKKVLKAYVGDANGVARLVYTSSIPKQKIAEWTNQTTFDISAFPNSTVDNFVINAFPYSRRSQTSTGWSYNVSISTSPYVKFSKSISGNTLTIIGGVYNGNTNQLMLPMKFDLWYVPNPTERLIGNSVGGSIDTTRFNDTDMNNYAVVPVETHMTTQSFYWYNGVYLQYMALVGTNVNYYWILEMSDRSSGSDERKYFSTAVAYYIGDNV